MDWQSIGGTVQRRQAYLAAPPLRQADTLLPGERPIKGSPVPTPDAAEIEIEIETRE